MRRLIEQKGQRRCVLKNVVSIISKKSSRTSHFVCRSVTSLWSDFVLDISTLSIFSSSIFKLLWLFSLFSANRASDFAEILSFQRFQQKSILFLSKKKTLAFWVYISHSLGVLDWETYSCKTSKNPSVILFFSETETYKGQIARNLSLDVKQTLKKTSLYWNHWNF